MSKVIVSLYDLSQGMARQMSPALLGKTIDGIWHTGMLFQGREWYFGGGICSDAPGCTPYGMPVKTYDMGISNKTREEFLAFLASVQDRFTMSAYHLLTNNCNNFTDACAVFLVGKNIPHHILDLPNEALNSPLGPMLRPMIESMQNAIRDQSAGHEVQLASASSAPVTPTPANAARQYWETPVTLERANRAAVVAKLKEYVPEFDESVGVAGLVALAVRLPAEKAFPAVDLLRLRAVVDEQSAEIVAKETVNLLERFVLDVKAPRPARTMTLRTAVNCFKFSASAAVLLADGSRETVIEACVCALGDESAPVRKTAACLVLNVAGAARRAQNVVQPLGEDHSVRLVFTVGERLNSTAAPVPEEVQALLSSLIVLVDNDPDARELLRTLDFNLARYTDPAKSADVKTRAVARHLSQIVSAP